ncbi:MAG TPA: CehA/McbA family metallohydrolase [Candidatus Limnocylindrales bacterium]|nr:CehA/McbA family metallohydrolase [Candidatus Limnocylindrales bacterium]
MTTGSALRRAAMLAAAILLLLAPADPGHAGCPGDCSVPGGGSALTDCILELNGLGLDPDGNGKSVTCTDGDPACDSDSSADGVCRVRVALCLNNDDPRLAECAPSDVSSVLVRNAPPTSARHDAGLAALQADVDAIAPTEQARCTELETVAVAVKTSSSRIKPGRRKIGVRASTSDGRIDSDKVRVTCLPAAPAPAVPACARAKVIENASELIGGQLARGRVGDYLLENDQVRVIVQKPGRVFFGIGTYGGNIIDADLQRPGEPGRDAFEELIPGINLENTSHFTDAIVLSDGADCSPATVRMSGVDDIFDFVNGSSAIRDMGFTFPESADDRDLPVEVQTDYTLETGDRYVRIDTTITNLDPEPLSIYFAEYINGSGQIEMWRPAYGFGEPLATTSCPASTYHPCDTGNCDPCNYIAFSGDDDAAGVSYGYIHTANGTTAVTVSGVVVPALGQEVAAVFLGAGAPNFHMAPAGSVGDAITITRYFAIGDGTVASIADVRNEIQSVPTGTLAGTVTAGGVPVANADVAVIGSNYPSGPDKNIVLHFRTGADGAYSGTLPAGVYTVEANKDGRLQASPSPASDVLVVAGNTTMQHFTLPEPGRLAVAVTDQSGEPIPAKVQLVGFDPSPDPENVQDVAGAITNTTGVFGDDGPDGSTHGIAFVAFADKNGSTGVLDVEPGQYQLVVSRGPRYSAFKQLVTVTAGATTSVAAQIAQVVETPGWITADWHVHSIDSPDSEVTRAERVATQIAEGTDFFTPSDHDYRSDFGPTIAAMGVGDLIATAPGAEITTFDYGHFNAWPVQIVPGALHGGGVDWGGAVAEAGQDFPQYGNYSLSPVDIYAMAHADTPGNVVQINHMYSHFDTLGLDIDTAEGDTGPPQSHKDPLARRLDPSIANHFSADFDALEVWIACNGRAGYEEEFLDVNLGDWINLLNQGIRRTGVTSSDTHDRKLTQINAHSFVAMPPELTSPSALGNAAVDVAASVREGRVAGSNGPFVEVSLTAASTGETASLAVTDSLLASTSDGAVTVGVQIRSPLWAEFDRVDFYVGSATERYDHDGDAATRERYRVTPTVSKLAGTDFMVSTVNDYPAIPDASHLEASVSLELTGLTEDTWVMVAVRGTDGVSRPHFPVYPNSLDVEGNDSLAALTDGNLGEGGMLSFAYTNPLFIDADNDDSWTPPGVQLVP